MNTLRRGSVEWIICAAFILTEAVLFGCVLYTTFVTGGGDGARYAVIVCCALYAMLMLLLNLRKPEKAAHPAAEKAAVYLTAAFLFSCAADFFLVFRPEKALPAVCLFGIAQVFHALRIGAFRGKGALKWAAARLVLIVIGMVTAALLRVRDPLIYAGIFYFFNLVLSFAESIVLTQKDRRFLILPIGLFLFILCDITVGINGMGSSLHLSEKLIRISADLTYVFYIPSQVLIALAGQSVQKES